MEILFENNFEKNKEWVTSISKYSFFKRPLINIFYIIYVLLFLYGLYRFFFNNVIDLTALLGPIILFITMFLLYCKNKSITYKRHLEINNGKHITVNSLITADYIEQHNSNGAQFKLYFSDVKKKVICKNYVFLLSKAKILYTIKKEGFTKGNLEDFLILLKNKGIK